MTIFRRLLLSLSCLFVVVPGCGDDGEPTDYCTCPEEERQPMTMFGLGESCYDGCNWTDCETGSQTMRLCLDAGP